MAHDLPAYMPSLYGPLIQSPASLHGVEAVYGSQRCAGVARPRPQLEKHIKEIVYILNRSARRRPRGHRVLPGMQACGDNANAHEALSVHMDESHK